MTKLIRKGFFETNSSSTHALVYNQNLNNIKTQDISEDISENYFGWENRLLILPEDKANYVLALISCKYEDDRDNLYNDFISVVGGKELNIDFDSNCYGLGIDHGSDYVGLNKEIMEQIIFGKSFIITSNDNGGLEVSDFKDILNKCLQDGIKGIIDKKQFDLISKKIDMIIKKHNYIDLDEFINIFSEITGYNSFYKGN